MSGQKHDICIFGQVSFNEPLSCWNVGSVEGMYGMFVGAKAFNQPLGSWDVSSVTDISGMFQYAEDFNQDLCDWEGQNAAVQRWSMFLRTSCPKRDDINWCAECIAPTAAPTD